MSLNNRPAGNPAIVELRCLVCRKILGRGDNLCWYGYEVKDERRFEGYFCSQAHKDEFDTKSREDRLIAVFGSLETVADLMAKLRSGEMRRETEADGMWKPEFMALPEDQAFSKGGDKSPVRRTPLALIGWIEVPQ